MTTARDLLRQLDMLVKSMPFTPGCLFVSPAAMRELKRPDDMGLTPLDLFHWTHPSVAVRQVT